MPTQGTFREKHPPWARVERTGAHPQESETRTSQSSREHAGVFPLFPQEPGAPLPKPALVQLLPRGGVPRGPPVEGISAARTSTTPGPASAFLAGPTRSSPTTGQPRSLPVAASGPSPCAARAASVIHFLMGSFWTLVLCQLQTRLTNMSLVWGATLHFSTAPDSPEVPHFQVNLRLPVRSVPSRVSHAASPQTPGGHRATPQYYLPVFTAVPSRTRLRAP